MLTIIKIHTLWAAAIVLIGFACMCRLVFVVCAEREIGKFERTLTRLYPIFIDIQILLGLILWVWGQRWTGWDPVRSWEHPVTMIVAAGLAHVGAKKVRAEGESVPVARKATPFFTVSWLLILLGIARVLANLS